MKRWARTRIEHQVQSNGTQGIKFQVFKRSRLGTTPTRTRVGQQILTGSVDSVTCRRRARCRTGTLVSDANQKHHVAIEDPLERKAIISRSSRTTRESPNQVCLSLVCVPSGYTPFLVFDVPCSYCCQPPCHKSEANCAMPLTLIQIDYMK